eukprot:TRINITY_DN11357_c0_g2_i1.p1 TRINITY_DN11357_c0_g2~~TRINITY_DN11357_c0_g2_i1.p1  ORF type:complete len:161 (+),score=70.29 TRINITY_DN11357_c0_g2_i1:491-973(+)
MEREVGIISSPITPSQDSLDPLQVPSSPSSPSSAPQPLVEGFDVGGAGGGREERRGEGEYEEMMEKLWAQVAAENDEGSKEYEEGYPLEEYQIPSPHNFFQDYQHDWMQGGDADGDQECLSLSCPEEGKEKEGEEIYEEFEREFFRVFNEKEEGEVNDQK